jgi:hypothetical protein
VEIKSILTNDFDHCFICGSPNPQWHHIMNGANKTKSEKYGLLVPLCMTHHTGMFGVHTDPERMRNMRKAGQRRFEELYGHDKWMEVFGKNYL